MRRRGCSGWRAARSWPAGNLSDVVTAELGTLRRLLVEFVSAGHRLTARPVSSDARPGGRALVHTLTGVIEGGALVRIWGMQRLAIEGPSVGEPLHHVQTLAVIGSWRGASRTTSTTC